MPEDITRTIWLQNGNVCGVETCVITVGYNSWALIARQWRVAYSTSSPMDGFEAQPYRIDQNLVPEQQQIFLDSIMHREMGTTPA